MQLPQSKARLDYTEKIKLLEANLKEATLGTTDTSLLATIQKRLDSLAEKYQYNEEIGKARYKLYELQAFIHFFNHHDDDALDFIDQAIEVRGETYPKAEKLKASLSHGDAYAAKTNDPSKMSKEQRRKEKIGLEGWLAVFTVGIIISTIAYFVAVWLWLMNLGNLGTVADTYVIDQLSPYYGFWLLSSLTMAGLSIWLLVLLFKWKRMAKSLGIVLLAASILLSLIDYIWYADLLTKLTGLSPQTGSAAPAWSVIWIIYLCVSKRVKRTLVK